MDIPSYLLGRIKGSGGAGVSYIVVEELPTTGEEGKIYLVPKEDSQTDNVYNEYMYIEEEWELIGDTQADLSNYQEKLVSGTNIKTINGNSVLGSGDLEIDGVNTILLTANEDVFGNISNYNTEANRQALAPFINDLANIDKYTIILKLKEYGSSDGNERYIPLSNKKFSNSGRTVGLNFINLAYNNRIDNLYTPLYNYNFSVSISENINISSATRTTRYTLANTLKLSQIDTLPLAQSSYLGYIYQYIGTTTQDYTNGYFYKCVQDGSTYKWENIEVQPQTQPQYIEDENGAKLFFVNKTTTKSKMYSTLTNFVKEVKNQPSSSWDTYPRLIITDSAGTDSYSNFYNNNITGIYCCDNPTSSYIMLYRMSNNIKIGTNENGTVIFDKTSKIRIDYNSSTYEVTNVQYYADNVNTTNFLSLNNTTAYTPTGDYNPATKKYVDDSIASAIGTALGGSY